MKKKLIIIGLGVFIGFMIAWPFLTKVQVNCVSQYGSCPLEVADKLKSLNGKNLFVAKRNAAKILKNEFIVSEFSMQFKLPNILHIDLLVKKPIFALKDSNTGGIILVDKDGGVLSGTTNTFFPTVEISGDLPKNGQNVGKENLFALELTAGVAQMYTVTSSKISESSLLVELPGQIRVIFPIDGDTGVLLGSLRLIYSKIEENGNPNGYREVDLRFKNPVLR